MNEAFAYMLYLINDAGYDYADAQCTAAHKFKADPDQLATMYDNLYN